MKIPKQTLLTSFIFVLCSIGPLLDSTMVNIALNELMKDLNTSLIAIQWGVTGYVLALAMAVPVSGWLLDHFNGKKLLIASVIFFGIFSLLTGLSWNVGSFIIFRILQGLAAGVISTVGMSLIMSIAPNQVLGRLMSIITIPAIFGPIIGPVLGGVFLQYLDWQWIFFINVPISIVSIVVVQMFVKDFAPFNPKSRIDVLGIVLLAGIASSFIYGLVTISDHINHLSFMEEGMILFAFVLTGLYVFWNHRQKGNVILPLRFFRNSKFSAASVGLFFGSAISSGPLLLLPLFFQNVRQYSAIQAALILIPQGLGMLLARPLIGRLIDSRGARFVVIPSVLFTALGSLPFIIADASTSIVVLAIALFIRGVGLSGVQLPMMTDIYDGIEVTDMPRASVASQMIQNIGMSFGSSMVSAVVALVISLQVTVKPQMATLHGYQIAFAVSTVFTLLMLVVSRWLSRNVSTNTR